MPTNAGRWKVTGGPEGMVPWEHAETSAAWVWTLRRADSGATVELSVRVSWKGFDSIEEIPSAVTREAYREKGRQG